ncbi:carboxymuconolactone decarboxylase family protein [Mycobacteroides abscessus]|uniref:carboxymuconolactone decarboxylase family protein n=1 Tax=Mycobacteroides abscessus TaxID=36809 RepID=UPI001056F22E|nr:carboxymuconolactone decarboxylase family protein [Mycobacteroides abscessus]
MPEASSANIQPIRIRPAKEPYSEDTVDLLQRIRMPVGRSSDPTYRSLATGPLPTFFALAARFPALGETLVHLRTFIHTIPGLPLRQRELIVHRLTARLDNEYEWSLHAASYGEPAGLDQDTLDATVTTSPGNYSQWKDADLLSVQLVDQLVDSNRIDDPLWRLLRQEYDEETLVSILFLTGFYAQVSWVMNSVRIPNEPGTPRFPHNRITAQKDSLSNEQ